MAAVLELQDLSVQFHTGKEIRAGGARRQSGSAGR